MRTKIVVLIVLSALILTSRITLNALSSVEEASPVDGEEWRMFQNNCQHTGYSKGNAPGSSQIMFKVNYARSHETYASPIVVDGKLVICGGSFNYSLYSLNATSGELLWRASQNFGSDSTPAASRDRVVIQSTNGYLYCFNLLNGSLVWKFRVSDGGYGNLPSPIVQNNTVFVAAGTTGVARERGHVYAISLLEFENASTPKLIWKKPLNSIVTSSPAFSKGKILLGYTTYNESISSEGDSCVVSLNAADGSLAWSYRVEKVYYVLRSSPTVVDGRVFFGSYGIVYALSEASGELLWKTELANSDIYASPAVANGRLFVGTLSRLGPTVPAVFACLNLSTGEIIWKDQMDPYKESPASSPAVADGKVFVSSGRRIYAFNETNGDVIWLFEPIGSSGGNSPAVADGAVYIIDQKGYVYAFGVPRFYHLMIASEHGNTQGDGFYLVGSKAEISVDSPIYVEGGVRYVFIGWTGDYVSQEMTADVTMNESKIITANWKLQYYLIVNSDFGKPQGEGWYDENATATFFVSSPDGFIIQYRFRHWVDDSTSSNSNSSILMNEPKIVTAIWEADYSQLIIIVAIIVFIIALLILALKRKS